MKVSLGRVDDPGLPAGALDAVLNSDAYREMVEHSGMLRGIRRALKPAGRLVILEKMAARYEGKSRDIQTRSHHIAMSIVESELAGAGSDPELLIVTSRVASAERRNTAELLALLVELDARRLYLGEGCSSLSAYCTQVLHFSEHAAYHRIETARAARYFPMILELIADGSLTTTTVALLRPLLTLENHECLRTAARYKTKREVEHQIACLAPKADVESLVRRVPEARPRAQPETQPTLADAPATIHPVPAPAPAPRPRIDPLASDRYLLRVTLGAEAHENLRRAQSLMTHTVANGDPAPVVERALALLVDHLERQKAATTRRPRKSVIPRVTTADSRYLPAAVRREVWTRDGGRCGFVGPQGRSTETGRLEFHHIVPFARGGAATSDNITLRCRAHNGYESERCFGR